MLATRDHFGKALVELAGQFPNVVVVNCDLGVATRTLEFKKHYPTRFIECGISEANAISLATGLAQEGFRPVVCSFGHFLTGKFLEIFQSIGLNNPDVTLVGTHAGLAIGKDGPTQMGLRDLGLMRLLPNVKILHPADGIETRQCLEFALSAPGPSYLRLCRQPTPEVHPEGYRFEFGKPVSLLSADSLLIVAQGGTVAPALEAARSLRLEGIGVGVLNLSSMPYSPESLLRLIPVGAKVVVVEDHFAKGGIAEDLAFTLLRAGKLVSLYQLAVSDYAQAATPEELYERYGLDAAGIRSFCLERVGATSDRQESVTR